MINFEYFTAIGFKVDLEVQETLQGAMWGTYDVERLLFWLRLMPAYPVCLILYKNQRLKPEKITSDLYSWCCLCSSVYTSENSKYHTTTDISDMIIYARLYIKHRLVTTKALHGWCGTEFAVLYVSKLTACRFWAGWYCAPPWAQLINGYSRLQNRSSLL